MAISDGCGASLVAQSGFAILDRNPDSIS